MAKTEKLPRTPKLTNTESAYLMMPWSCNHYPTYSEIEAYIPITGDWEIIADIHDTKGVDAEVLTGLIARAVNLYPKYRELIARMTAALELRLACRGGLSREAEQETEAGLKTAREMEQGRS